MIIPEQAAEAALKAHDLVTGAKQGDYREEDRRPVEVEAMRAALEAACLILGVQRPEDVVRIVEEAMQDAWNTICSDTDCHPTDIEQNFEGRENHLGFHPAHWARLTGETVAHVLALPHTGRPQEWNAELAEICRDFAKGTSRQAVALGAIGGDADWFVRLQECLNQVAVALSAAPASPRAEGDHVPPDDHAQVSRDMDTAGWKEFAPELSEFLDDVITSHEFCDGNAVGTWRDGPLGRRARKLLAALSASPPPPVAESGWQKIETAPKNGEYVDLGSNTIGRIADCQWNGTTWISSGANGTTAEVPESFITHWMYRPAPPPLLAEKREKS